MKRLLLVCLLAACGGSSAASPDPVEPEPVESEPEPGDGLTAEACEAQGGTLVGDIGDGATQRPDYVCPSGQPPIGRVALGIEGSVCCPGDSAPADQ
jgi:hypothetical protein